jgi:hypothetical protein
MNIVGKTIMVVLFGEQLDEPAGGHPKASRDNVVQMLADMKLVDAEQPDVASLRCHPIASYKCDAITVGCKPCSGAYA